MQRLRLARALLIRWGVEILPRLHEFALINAAGTSDKDISLIKQASSLGASHGIIQAIKTAADKTGVDFSYLLNKASQESSFDPKAKASTSSATGLYQFTCQTWLRMVKDQGAAYGLGKYADHIKLDANGHASVDNPAIKNTILALRNDPTISSEMAAELDKQNLDALKDNVGGKVGGTELYLAHFLGAGGASTFLNRMKDAPNTKAANVLPEAASANSSVFFNADGSARSLKQIYNHFAQKFDSKFDTSSMVANNTTTTQPAAKVTPLANLPTHNVADASQYLSHFSMISAPDDSNAYPAAGIADYSASLAQNINSTTSSIHSSTNSLYATMVLAQMNVDGLSTLSTLGNAKHSEKDDDNKKQNAINLLTSIG